MYVLNVIFLLHLFLNIFIELLFLIMASWLNISGTVSAFRLLKDPALCLPHHTVSTFNHLPIPLSDGIKKGKKSADIRAVVLDKDNCFAIPHQNEVFEQYKVCAVFL
jgi:hypothetical protein